MVVVWRGRSLSKKEVRVDVYQFSTAANLPPTVYVICYPRELRGVLGAFVGMLHFSFEGAVYGFLVGLYCIKSACDVNDRIDDVFMLWTPNVRGIGHFGNRFD